MKFIADINTPPDKRKEKKSGGISTEDKKALQAITRGITKSRDQLPLPVQQIIERARKQRGG